MVTIQELKSNGAKSVSDVQGNSDNSNLGPTLTIDQLKANGAKSVSDVQGGDNTEILNTQKNKSLSPGSNLPEPSFNPVKDILGIGAPQKDKGFIPSVIKSTIGSEGVAGSAQLPGKTVAALTEYGPGGKHQAESLYNDAEKNSQLALDMIKKARSTTDPILKKKYLDIATNSHNANLDLISKASDIQNLTDTTAKKALGTTINSELTLATAGGDSLLGNAGVKVAKPLVAGTSDIFSATKYYRLGLNTLENAGVGAAFQAASNLNEDKKLTDNLKSAALWGGIIPLAIHGSVAAKDALQKGSQLSGEGIINRIIRPAVKDLGYGKEPAQGILNEGITANSLNDLKTKVSERLNQIGLGIHQVGQAVQEKLGNTLDLTPSLRPLDDAMNQAARLNNPSLLNRLNNIKIALTHDLELVIDKATETPSIKMGNARNLTQTGYENAVALMKDVQAHTQWTGNPSDDKILNVTGQKVQQSLRNIMNDAADKADPQLGSQIRNLNQRFGDLMGAAGAISHREIVAQRNNFFNLTQKLGIGAGLASGLLTGLVSGNWLKAGELLAGEAGLLGLSKITGSTAVQTRVAKFLDMLGPVERKGILNSTPVLENLYTRFTGKVEPLAPAQETIPKKAISTIADKIGVNPENIDKLKTFMGLGKKAAEKAGLGEEYNKIMDHVSSTEKPKNNIDPELGF